LTATVAIVMGSKSDLPKVQPAIEVLREFRVPFVVRVMSAHRTPAVVAAFADQAASQGLKVLIAAAGGAAHLAGTVAAHTLLPVIGIPVSGGVLDGLDALLSTVQMPGGIPVATVGVGSGGAQNAGLLAVAILALSQPELQRDLEAFRARQREKVAAADSEIQQCL